MSPLNLKIRPEQPHFPSCVRGAPSSDHPLPAACDVSLLRAQLEGIQVPETVNEAERVVAFEFAVCEVEADNTQLAAQLTAYDIHDTAPRHVRLNRLLDCEQNGAHVHLEHLASAAKRIPRGEIPSNLLDRLQASCCDLLFFIDDFFKTTAVSSAVAKAQNTEVRLVNFLKGVSGAGENLLQEDYEKRIDKFIDAIKTDFRELLAAIAAFERLNSQSQAPIVKPAHGKHSRQRKYSARAEQEIIDFVERPDFDLGRERAGVTYYDITRAAHAWAQLKHPRTLPRDAEEFKKAYRSIRDRKRRKKHPGKTETTRTSKTDGTTQRRFLKSTVG